MTKEISVDIIAHFDKYGCGSNKLFDQLLIESNKEEKLRNRGNHNLRRAMVMNHPNVKVLIDKKRTKNLLTRR